MDTLSEFATSGSSPIITNSVVPIPKPPNARGNNFFEIINIFFWLKKAKNTMYFSFGFDYLFSLIQILFLFKLNIHDNYRYQNKDNSYPLAENNRLT